MDLPNQLPESGRSPSLVRLILALSFALTAVGLTAVRTYQDYAPLSREFSFDRMGLFDFHNGGRQPAMAFRDGVNPYSQAACEPYTLTRPAPAYSPVVFMQHLPFTFMSLEVADIVYWFFNLTLILLLAYWALTMSHAKFVWSWWLGIVGLFVLSRPGHISLYTGYFTAQLVVGTVVALHFGKSKPWLAGMGMVLASGKPTYILPLTIVMLARKNFRAALLGVVFCGVAAAAGLGWLASFSSLEQVIEGVQSGQEAFQQDANEDPVNTWTRLDILGVVCKIAEWKPGNQVYLVCMLGLLVLPCIAIWKMVDQERNSGMTGLSALIASLAVLLTIYHHAYDCLLLAIPWVALACFGERTMPELSRVQRWFLAILLGLPAANYASTYKVRELLGLETNADVWNVVTSINGVCLFLALAIAVFVALRPSKKAAAGTETNGEMD